MSPRTKLPTRETAATTTPYAEEPTRRQLTKVQEREIKRMMEEKGLTRRQAELRLGITAS